MIGNNVKMLRNIRGLTQKELADIIDIAPATLWNIENGTRNPSLEMLYKLADALSVSVINLLLSEEEIDRFYFDAEIQLRYPNSERLKELLSKVLENMTAWDHTKRIAIIDLDDFETK